MKSDVYEIRTMSRQDLDTAVRWAGDEGWNPGIHDGDTFYATDPGGFFMGWLDGEPISCISAVTYGDRFGFLGFYIVIPGFRGRGYGIKIWNRGMEYLGKRNIGLDGVVAQQDNYRKSGFKLTCRNIRYGGIAKSVDFDRSGLCGLDDLNFESLLKYDSEMFAVPRPEFLNLWVRQLGSLFIAFVEDGTIKGYGVIRPCGVGFKIGPLFADNPPIAEKIFNWLCEEVSGKEIFLDTPEPNAFALKMAEKYGMKPVFETARMYTGDTDILPVNKIFGITTFELG